VILCSFGDMLRVPARNVLLTARRLRQWDGYSPLDSVTSGAKPTQCFFRVGSERRRRRTPSSSAGTRLRTSPLVSHVLVPPALAAILSAPDNRVQGLLAAGHVCAVMGTAEYGPLAGRHRVPMVVTGFEPVDILQGVLRCVELLEAGRAEVANAYGRAVRAEGNPRAQAAIHAVFEETDHEWRGLGPIPRSGYALRPELRAYDAAAKFGLEVAGGREPAECLAGAILRGNRKPHECPAFGGRCTPEHPLGAPMVSSEGPCAAYHRYRTRKP
jgi:hydrogenase expression/formation protein HypD